MSAPPTYQAATSDWSGPFDDDSAAQQNLQPQQTHQVSRAVTAASMMNRNDERRPLPAGWVRCYDPSSEHVFYVEESTRRSIWVHPYDDPAFLASLPDDDPTNPNGSAARQAREQAEQERRTEERLRAKAREADGPVYSSQPAPAPSPPPPPSLNRMGSSGFGPASSTSSFGPAGFGAPNQPQHGHKSWLQKKKDKLSVSKDERQRMKEQQKEADIDNQIARTQQQQDMSDRVGNNGMPNGQPMVMGPGAIGSARYSSVYRPMPVNYGMGMIGSAAPFSTPF
ncbi:hypothetical protein BD324DRAFT_620384 [Kockovaella imperatae]|uniref:WW domain-containing protein n=1 Tax=Kockovaella imperatae TaxID=4999 RepID=A0A1Y1UL76_9TREE|nr:hypothetical protein BD324DRAFT_620384 [Kockovaella imperatae]ORX38307.1 hypothetical protein BD324DRAFT_620384 [Kockovaella imperatae]